MQSLVKETRLRPQRDPYLAAEDRPPDPVRRFQPIWTDAKRINYAVIESSG